MKKVLPEWVLYLIAAFLFTLFLGYIDEGYYNFKFLTSIGNVLVLSVYMLVLWACELLVASVLQKKLSTRSRIIFSMVIGLVVPIIIILWVAA